MLESKVGGSKEVWIETKERVAQKLLSIADAFVKDAEDTLSSFIISAVRVTEKQIAIRVTDDQGDVLAETKEGAVGTMDLFRTLGKAVIASIEEANLNRYKED